MIVRSPIRHALSMSLILLLTLGVCLQADAQKIPVPTADLLPTPDEVKGAPVFPLYDGACKGSDKYRLPPELTVTYSSLPESLTCSPISWAICGGTPIRT